MSILPHLDDAEQRVAFDPTPWPGTTGPGWFDSSFELRAGLDVREQWHDAVRIDATTAALAGAAPGSGEGAASSGAPARRA